MLLMLRPQIRFIQICNLKMHVLIDQCNHYCLWVDYVHRMWWSIVCSFKLVWCGLIQSLCHLYECVDSCWSCECNILHYVILCDIRNVTLSKNSLKILATPKIFTTTLNQLVYTSLFHQYTCMKHIITWIISKIW